MMGTDPYGFGVLMSVERCHTYVSRRFHHLLLFFFFFVILALFRRARFSYAREIGILGFAR